MTGAWPPDPASAPRHYRRGGLECRDVERALLSDTDVSGPAALMWMDALEYLFRWDLKGGAADLVKARSCIDGLLGEIAGGGCGLSGKTHSEAGNTPSDGRGMPSGAAAGRGRALPRKGKAGACFRAWLNRRFRRHGL